MALIKTTETYISTSANYGVTMKAIMDALVTLGAVTLISVNTESTAEYNAYYRLNGIASNIRLKAYNSSYTAYFKLSNEDDSVVTSTLSASSLNSGITFNMTYYRYANDKMRTITVNFVYGGSSQRLSLTWGNLNVFGENTEKGFANMGTFGYDSSLVLSVDATKPSMDNPYSIGYLERAWGEGIAVALPVFLYDQIIPWKGVNNTYFYYSSINPSQAFTSFKIGNTEMFYLGNGFSVIA